MKTRDQAMELLRKHIRNENLIKHCMAVESAMRHYARLFNEDEEKWALTGLLHDIDYESSPQIEKHSIEGARILKEEGYDEDIVQAVKSHNRHHGLPLDTLMEKTLLAVDELTGLITAAALVRPSKSVNDLKVKSVKKRLKEKAFAKSVNREEIREGAVMIDKQLEEHIQNVIDAMRKISHEIGL